MKCLLQRSSKFHQRSPYGLRAEAMLLKDQQSAANLPSAKQLLLLSVLRPREYPVSDSFCVSVVTLRTKGSLSCSYN